MQNRPIKGQSGSCSIHVAEMSHAYTIGHAIGFENRGGKDLDGNTESTTGESTSKL